MMILHAGVVPGEAGSNLPASVAPEPQLLGAALRIDKAEVCLQSVCVFCNNHKGPNIAGIDPVSRKIAPLYNPRRHKWGRHFRWEGPVLCGLTAIGRATVAVLEINLPYRVALRQALIEGGVFPARD